MAHTQLFCLLCKNSSTVDTFLCLCIYTDIYVGAYFVYKSRILEVLGKKSSASIYQKLKIIKFAHDQIKLGKPGEKTALLHFPHLLKPGMLTRWKSTARKQKWHLLPVKVATMYKEVPNWLRKSFSLRNKGRAANGGMPLELLKQFDRALCSRIHGLDPENLECCEPLKTRSMVRLMKALMVKYNAEVQRNNKVAQEHNRTLLQQFKDGLISAADAKEGKQSIRPKVTKNNIWCYTIYIVCHNTLCVYIIIQTTVVL